LADGQLGGWIPRCDSMGSRHEGGRYGVSAENTKKKKNMRGNVVARNEDVICYFFFEKHNLGK
jgi:hypothetical protein